MGGGEFLKQDWKPLCNKRKNLTDLTNKSSKPLHRKGFHKQGTKTHDRQRENICSIYNKWRVPISKTRYFYKHMRNDELNRKKMGNR